MTWTQLGYFARAVALEETDRWLTLLAVVHNPYAKDEQSAKKLFKSLEEMRRRLEAPRDGSAQSERPAPRGGVKLGELLSHFGGAVIQEADGTTRRMTPQELSELMRGSR